MTFQNVAFKLLVGTKYNIKIKDYGVTTKYMYVLNPLSVLCCTREAILDVKLFLTPELLIIYQRKQLRSMFFHLAETERCYARSAVQTT